MSEINVQMYAEQTQLLAELAKQQASIQKSIDKFGKLASAGTRAGESSTRMVEKQDQAITRFLPKLTSMAAGYLSVAGVVGTITSEMEKLSKEADRALMKIEDLQKRWRIQSGLRGLEADVSQKAIERISIANAVAPELGYRTATQLVSSGASVKEATGDALDAMQDVSMASNLATGASPEEITNAVISYLTSQGLEATGANIRKIGGGVQQVFRGGNLQLGDLTELAKVGSSLRTLRPDEQVAAMTALKDLGNTGATAATGLEGMVMRLETAKASNAKVAALKRIGLTPEDVDFVGEGEDLNVVLGRLDKGLSTIPEEDRKSLMKTLVEEAGVKTLSGLMASRDKIDRYVGAQGNLDAFEADVAEAQSGVGAARIRNEGAREARMSRMALDVEGRSLAMGESAIARGALPIQAELQRGAFERGTNWTGSLTGGRVAAAAVEMLPSALLSLGLSSIGGPLGGLATGQVLGAQARSTGQGLGEAERQYMETMQAHTEALKENTAATKANTTATSGAAPASSPPRPAAPRPAQARSR